MAALRLYREERRLLSKDEVHKRRKELFANINGDAFFKVKTWPQDIQSIFWRKPTGDRDTFKLALFLKGNWCAPDLFIEWILLSQYWSHSSQKAEKRARQIDFVLSNEEVKKGVWFYFDVDYNKLKNDWCKRDGWKKEEYSCVASLFGVMDARMRNIHV